MNGRVTGEQQEAGSIGVEWYRNTTWNESIEAVFLEKLDRKKLKAQYLRVQASILAKKHPEVTLKLLEMYFDLPDDVERVQAHVDRATALLALERIDDAVDAYESALAREAENPQQQTQAHLDLPLLIASRHLGEHYDRALELLEAYESQRLFPVDYFKWHATHALICAERDELDNAQFHVQESLKAAARDHSGFDSHPNAGLVKNRFEDVIKMLKSLEAS